MVPEYRPWHQTQLDDDPRFRRVNCNLNAIGETVDKDSLGLVRPDPNRLRRALAPDVDGTTMAQALYAIERVYGWRLEQRDVTRGELRELLSEGRGATIHIVREALGDLGGFTFDGTHGVHAQEYQDAARRYLLSDTLLARPVWIDSDRLEAAGLAFGELVDEPGRIRVALTRPARIAPRVVVRGRFFRYTVRGDQATGRRAYGSSSTRWSAVTEIPDGKLYKGTRRQLVLVDDAASAYDGWWIEPRADVVRYAGEL